MRGVELLNQRLVGGLIVTEASVRRGQHPADAADQREFVRRQEFMRDVTRMLDRARELGPRGPMATVPAAGYCVHTGTSAIALTGATAKTVMYLLAGSSNQPSITELSIGFDGVTASNVSALVELVLGTAATNSTPGTASTTFTPVQVRGWPTMTPVTTAANLCTSEPTVLTVARPWLVTPNAGLLVIQMPLGREPTGLTTGSTSGKVTGLRVNAPNSVNVRGYLDFEE